MHQNEIMRTDLKPVIYEIDDNAEELLNFRNQMESARGKNKTVLLDYPTVYIHNWKNDEDYEVYIGETNNIIRRTKQHYDMADDEHNWQYRLKTGAASLYIIGHEHFNKSLTLDIENRLMQYMISCERVKKIHNLQSNPQNRYYPDYELNDIFKSIWNQLRKNNAALFPKESAIKASPLFKASPLHKLTPEQENIKDLIIHKVFQGLKNRTVQRQLIFIEGEAGTGKTVLNSSTFYHLYVTAEEQGITDLQCYMMVNHDEQILVYQQIAEKLGLKDKYGDIVCKPTTFINHHAPDRPIDVAFIDEAHLLLTQGKQSYQGDNQLEDIINRARITVVMFDENQTLTTEQYLEAQILERFRNSAKKNDTFYELRNQLRIAASEETIAWIDDFTKNLLVSRLKEDEKGYEVKVFDQPRDLELAIRNKAAEKDHGLSRMIATYDWEYNQKKAMNKRMSDYWEVLIGDWHKPWNRELEKSMDRKDKRRIRTLSWAEQPQTIDEVGSTFTIQGFDLNYAGVILGPSVTYRDGKVVFNTEVSFNTKATRNRSLKDGSKKKFGEELLRHEVRVLMTRGVNGLYIYAYDEAQREALKDAVSDLTGQVR